MANLDPLIKAWDEAIWEYSLVFEDLADEDVWKRPHPRLLSVGEITGHAAYWEAQLMLSLAEVKAEPIQSPLDNPAFKYYTTQVENPTTLDIGAEALIAEFKRIQAEVRDSVLKLDPQDGDPVAGKEGWTWGAVLRYRAFHNAYHCGQAFSVRHIFGHKTNDN